MPRLRTKVSVCITKFPTGVRRVGKWDTCSTGTGPDLFGHIFVSHAIIMLAFIFDVGLIHFIFNIVECHVVNLLS